MRDQVRLSQNHGPVRIRAESIHLRTHNPRACFSDCFCAATQDMPNLALVGVRRVAKLTPLHPPPSVCVSYSLLLAMAAPAMPTQHQKELVQKTWTSVEPIAETAAGLFYNRLFELDPSLKALFSTDIKEQGRKLMKMITTAVRGLDNLDALIPAVQALGKRHAGYGVKGEHFATVAAALLWTLEKGLGDAWNEEVKAAWVVVYTVLATVMKQAGGMAA